MIIFKDLIQEMYINTKIIKGFLVGLVFFNAVKYFFIPLRIIFLLWQ